MQSAHGALVAPEALPAQFQELVPVGHGPRFSGLDSLHYCPQATRPLTQHGRQSQARVSNVFVQHLGERRVQVNVPVSCWRRECVRDTTALLPTLLTDVKRAPVENGVRAAVRSR